MLAINEKSSIRFPLEFSIKDDLFVLDETVKCGDRVIAHILKSEVTDVKVLIDYDLFSEPDYCVIGYNLEKININEENIFFTYMLGTTPFGYQHPKYPNIQENDGFIVYERIVKGKLEDIEMIDENDTPFVTTRDSGLPIKINEKPAMEWAYVREEENGYPTYFLAHFRNMDKTAENQAIVQTYEGVKANISTIEILQID